MFLASNKINVILYSLMVFILVLSASLLLYEKLVILEAIKSSINEQNESVREILFSLKQEYELLNSEKMTLIEERKNLELSKVSLIEQIEKFEATKKASFFNSPIVLLGIALTTIHLLVSTRIGPLGIL